MDDFLHALYILGSAVIYPFANIGGGASDFSMGLVGGVITFVLGFVSGVIWKKR